MFNQMKEVNVSCSFTFQDFKGLHGRQRPVGKLISRPSCFEQYDVKITATLSRELIEVQIISEKKIDFAVRCLYLYYRKAGQLHYISGYSPQYWVNSLNNYSLLKKYDFNKKFADDAILENGSLFFTFTADFSFPYIFSDISVDKIQKTDIFPNTSIELCNGPNASMELANLFQNQKFSNVEISCGDKNFSAHKCVLWSRSLTFAKIFDDEDKNTKTNIITVDDVSADVLEEGLYFLYTGKCRKVNEMATELLTFAEIYGVADLKQVCEKELIKTMSVENICGYFVLSDKNNATNLRESCMNFIKDNTKSILAAPEWKVLAAEQPGLVAAVLEAVVLR